MTEEQQYQYYRAESTRLKQEINILQKKRSLLTDPTEIAAAKEQVKALQEQYNQAHQNVEAIRERRRMGMSIEREFNAMEAGLEE